MPLLKSVQTTQGSEEVLVYAYVEDMVQVAPATQQEDPQFAGAFCWTLLHWSGDPQDPLHGATLKRVEQAITLLKDLEWYPVPPITFPEDE